jgi:hypothetical protein
MPLLRFIYRRCPMDKAMLDALAEYGRTIKAHGWTAGEPLIDAGEIRFKDFRKFAHALGIMLRTKEILDG